MKYKFNKLTFCIFAVGVLTGILLSQTKSEFYQSVPVAKDQVQLKLPLDPKIIPPPEQIAKPHLAWAQQQCDAVISDHLHSIDIFFAERKKHTHAFADVAMNWGSKWRLVIDYVPFTKGGRHENYIKDKFEEYIFKPEQLEETVKQVVASYLKQVDSIEDKMLVRIRADVVDFPEAYLISGIDASKVRSSYYETIKGVLENSTSNNRDEIALLIVSEISGAVLTQVATKLGVSAGILGSGASLSVYSFGAGMIVGIIVDYFVSWVWDWYADPKGNLSKELDAKLDQICELIIEGTSDSHGLRDELKNFAIERSELRKKAVMKLLNPPK